MFNTIFSFELKQWLTKPLFYIYAMLMVGVASVSMAAAGGMFDSNTATVSSLTWINSPLQMVFFIGGLSYFAIFLLPSIVGATLQKDYKNNVFKLLYSFPFNKSDYVFSKFLSGFLIAVFLMVFIGFGAVMGTSYPGVDQGMVGPNRLISLLKIYGVWVLPNLFLFSVVVFSVTLYSRSIIAGFIALAVLFFGQGIADTFLLNQEKDVLGAYLDPFGFNALNYYTKYWTIVEQNENPLPIKGLIIYNRLIWFGVAIAIAALSYLKFTFDYAPPGLPWRKKSAETKTPFSIGKLQRVELPKVTYHHNIVQTLKAAWALTKIDLRYVLTGGPFIVISIIGVLFIVILAAFGGQILSTSTLPVTRELLTIPGFMFRMFITLLTFIYMGLLIFRTENLNVFQLEDSTPTSNWSFLLSKLMTVVLMQIVLLAIIMFTGIAIQIYNGYYHFEVGLYLTDLYGVRLLGYVIWALLALMIFCLVPNFYIGLVVLLGLSIGMNFLDEIGIEQDLFMYNNGPNAFYSDMSGWTSRIDAYYLYKIYWLGLGVTFFGIALLLWRRGMRYEWIKSIKKAKTRFGGQIASILTLGMILFLGLGAKIYYDTNIKEEFVRSKQREFRTAEAEKLYKRFQFLDQPKITDVNLNIDLIPESRDFKASGSYVLKNKSPRLIDTLFTDVTRLTKKIELDVDADVAIYDSMRNIRVYSLAESLSPGDSITMTFELENEPNRILYSNTPVRKNGTFFNSSIFPQIGYDDNFELTDDKTRKKYDLEPKERMAPPTDSTARMSNYISTNADWVRFEAIVSTAPDQIAMVPGQLQREWEEDGRRYFHYQMQRKMLNFYNVISARYEEYQEEWNGIPVTIYYHKGHDFNLDRLMKGAKQALEYCSTNFSPYQHGQVRILEFPVTSGQFAQSFANTIPFSEGVGFIAKVDDSDKGGIDYPFSVSAHEIAHQWWAHQVIGAKTQGATLMSESLSEYTSLKVLEHEYGKKKMRKFLKDALDKYLLGRALERKKEQPLIYVENQQHIHYNKGAHVLYALSDYIGEEKLSAALSRYIDSVGFQEPPYTTSLEFMDFMYAATPDSLDYFIDDMLAHITVYNNRILTSEFSESDDGYEVSFTAQVSKYRAGDKGQRIYSIEGDSLLAEVEGQSRKVKSLPLVDYVDVGIFGRDEDNPDEEIELYFGRHKITDISNEFTITVDQEPVEVGIDPYNKLIDTNSEDNRQKVSRGD